MISIIWFKIYIMYLVMLDPVSLFHKINQLPWYRDTLRVWADNLKYSEKQSILEVGTATGLLANYLDNRGLQVYGIDLSTDMILKAKEVNPEKIDFRQGNVLRMPFDDNQFNFVIAASLINVISEREKGLREMVRVCKKGGKVSVLVPREGMTQDKLDDLITQLHLEGFSREALISWNNYAKKMSLHSLENLFKAAELNNIQSTEYLNGMVIGMTGEK